MTARVVFYVRGVAKTNPLNDSLPRSMGAARAIKSRHAKDRASALSLCRHALRMRGVHPVDVLPALVVLKRVSSGKGFDSDGTVASCKWVRDAVAEALGIDDGGPFVRWEYANHKGKRGQVGVIVRIERDLRRAG